MCHSLLTDLVTKGFDLKTIMEYTHTSKEQKKYAIISRVFHNFVS